jgi:hypothetical protein
MTCHFPVIDRKPLPDKRAHRSRDYFGDMSISAGVVEGATAAQLAAWEEER